MHYGPVIRLLFKAINYTEEENYMKNNLFNYATSELSQDAFICYLLSFAMKEYEMKDKQLNHCAKELLGKFISSGEEFVVTAIHRQHFNIDALIEVNNKYNIIIEDKTFTGQHHDQINAYKETLIGQGKGNIICVYYKIVEQPKPEPYVINITRTDLLKIFRGYHTDNHIFNHYVEYLEWIDKDVNSYKTIEISQWRKMFNHVYRGFFTHLAKYIIDTSKGFNWGYVPNKSGGFWSLWWFGLSIDELKSCGLGETNELYLQIEDNIIAVKCISEYENSNNTRWKLYEYFLEQKIGFKKKSFRPGKHMTVGYIEYDEKNYVEKIKVMETTMKKIANGELKDIMNEQS